MNRKLLRSALSMLVNRQRMVSPPSSPTTRILAAARAAAERRLADRDGRGELSAADRARLAARLGRDPQSPKAPPSLRDSDPPE